MHIGFCVVRCDLLQKLDLSLHAYCRGENRHIRRGPGQLHWFRLLRRSYSLPHELRMGLGRPDSSSDVERQNKLVSRSVLCVSVPCRGHSNACGCARSCISSCSHAPVERIRYWAPVATGAARWECVLVLFSFPASLAALCFLCGQRGGPNGSI